MKVFVLAGGFDQIALIEELKKRGHDVILADYLEHPPAQSFVRKHFRVSTLDEQAVYNIALQENVDLITTACTDQALLTVAKVSEKLGLPCYINSEVAKNVTDKFFMKKIFRNNNIPTANFCAIDDSRIIDCRTLDVNFPVIVKPCDCNSSKGVIKVEDNLNLEEAVRCAFNLSRTRKVIIEEYIDGQEISVDVWVDRENAKVLSVSKSQKIKKNTDAFTIYESCYPVCLSEFEFEKIKNIAKKISDTFGIYNSPMLIQVLVKDGNVNVIEFSARMGGGSKYKFIEYMSGVDIMDTYVNMILGNESQLVNPVMSPDCIEVDYVYGSKGTISSIVNFDILKEQGIIDEVFYYKNIGDYIEKMTTSSDRILGFMIHGNDEAALRELRRKVIESVDILDVSGKSIMYKECFLGDNDED